MLISLRIRNFALIEDVMIEWGAGLNILSGETGSGKSMIVQALELLLGGRGSADLIRQGEEEAEVSGLFEIEGEEISLRRVVSGSGKGRAYWNERPVPVSVLAKTGERVVDLATQHEHQILLQPETHLLLLDEFADLEESRASYRKNLAAYQDLLKGREALAAREKEVREREDFLRFQQKELQEARIGEGEEESLQREREVVRHAVRLGEICFKGEEALESGEDSVTERIGRVMREIGEGAAIDPSLAPAGREVEEALLKLGEVAKNLRRYGEKLSFDPARLQEIEDRLFLIARLKKKYGGSLEALAQKEREISEGLRLLDHFDEEIQKRDEALSRLGDGLAGLARRLSEGRNVASTRLSREVEGELRELGMEGARFSVRLGPLSNPLFEIGGRAFGEPGCEEGEFLIAPNPGEGSHPLARIASGGELSRIFLAIKKILGKGRGAPTSVFDEVDVGIGGAVAEVIGKNLSFLARKKQILCVTHLPQIACYADHHFVAWKRTEGGRTGIGVWPLRKEEREVEIARMLAGLRVTDRVKAHAREMLRHAEK